jgi:hypothetical protein
MKQLSIVWKRLVVDGQTCERCGATSQQLANAFDTLEAALKPLGIQPVLETRSIDEATFKAQPSESNRIWIGGRPMEEWLGADVGMTPCCSVCGDSQCRTVQFDGRTYETVPQALLVKAGLIAASRLVSSQDPSPRGTSCTDSASCCS